MRRSYLDYSMSVIIGRALPDVRDGFKPVHRRILYTMHEMGLQHNKEHTKCAKVVGQAMGEYHPHGDYEQYVVMQHDDVLLSRRRMVLAHCLSDHLGALGVLLVVLQTHLVHRVQDAAMHRLEAVADIGQRTADDDRHRIVEIRTPHLVFNVDGNHVGGAGTGGRCCAVSAVSVWTAEGKLRILIVCHR